MCVDRGKLDAKQRRMLALGNGCLAIGLSLQLFLHPAGAMEKNWLHAVVGLLLGVSIGVNLFGLRMARRCRESHP